MRLDKRRGSARSRFFERSSNAVSIRSWLLLLYLKTSLSFMCFKSFLQIVNVLVQLKLRNLCFHYLLCMWYWSLGCDMILICHSRLHRNHIYHFCYPRGILDIQTLGRKIKFGFDLRANVDVNVEVLLKFYLLLRWSKHLILNFGFQIKLKILDLFLSLIRLCSYSI